MKNTRYTSSLYRAEDFYLIHQLLEILKIKSIDKNKFLIYSDSDNIYNLELLDKTNIDLKYRVIKEVKKFIRRKIKSYNGNLNIYTFLSLYIPDKALSIYKINTINNTVYTGDLLNDNSYFSYNDNGRIHSTALRSDAIKHAIKHASDNAFSYITGKDYV